MGPAGEGSLGAGRLAGVSGGGSLGGGGAGGGEAQAVHERASLLDPAQHRGDLQLPHPGRGADLGGSAAATTFGLVRASSVGWGAAQTVGLIAAGLASFVVFVLIEGRARQPLLQVSLLRRPAFAAVLVTALLLNAGAFAYLAYSSLWLQTVLGLSPVQAGLAGAAPMSLSAFVVSAAIGRFLHVSSPRWIIGGGLALVGAGALLQAGLGAGSAWTHLVPGLIVAGIGVGLATPTLVSSAMAAVPVRSGGMAAGAVNTMRQLGYAFGIAVLGSVFSARAAHEAVARGARPSVAQAVSGGQAQRLLASVPAGQRPGLDQIVHAASAAGLNGAFLLAGALGLAGAVVALAGLRRRATLPDSPRPGAGQTAARPEAVQPDAVHTEAVQTEASAPI